jgi:two-component system, LuxR family, sensor kinase FixL
VVTGYADLQGAIVALRQGAADYILKPIKPEELRARLAHIAARKRADAELREAQQRALQAERLAAIGQTVTSMAHESRNALQRIQAALEMLAPEVQDRPAALEYVADIQQAEEGLLRLYEQLRRYAAPAILNREKSHLGDILQEAWFQLLGTRKGRECRLQEQGAEIDLEAQVDWFAIGQVFRNILENSLAACPDPVEIDVAWAETTLNGRPAVRVAIQDNGPGMTAEQKQRIFEPFFTTKRHGTGLGMAIAKNIVDSHGGQIMVGPGRGRGTEIVIVIPREVL